VQGGTTPVTETSTVWKGVDTTNDVRIGFGRTWNFGVRFEF